MVLFRIGRFTDLFPWIKEISACTDARYNVAPTQNVAAMMNDRPHAVHDVRWGLVPHWAKDVSIGSKMINARAETVNQKSAFKTPLSKQRCLVLADGFYEWHTDPHEKLKTPMYVTLKNQKPMAMAGLWERWRSHDGVELRTCAVITTSPNDLMATIHNRMPVIVSEPDWDRWLDPQPGPADSFMDLLTPYESSLMQAHPVSRAVNTVSSQGPDLIRQVQVTPRVEQTSASQPAASRGPGKSTRRATRLHDPSPGLFD